MLLCNDCFYSSPPAMSRQDVATSYSFPSHLSIKVLGKYTLLKIGTPPAKKKAQPRINIKRYRRSFFHLDRLEDTFNNFGELLYGGLVLLLAPLLFVYFSVTNFVLYDGTELFLQTIGIGALVMRVFVLIWIARQSSIHRCSLQDPLLLAIVMPAIACIVAGIFLSDVEEERRALFIGTQQEKTNIEPSSRPELPVQPIPVEIVPVQPISPAAHEELIAARQKRIQELEEAELARIAS
jgi:hypothetical protein